MCLWLASCPSVMHPATDASLAYPPQSCEKQKIKKGIHREWWFGWMEAAEGCVCARARHQGSVSIPAAARTCSPFHGNPPGVEIGAGCPPVRSRVKRAGPKVATGGQEAHGATVTASPFRTCPTRRYHGFGGWHFASLRAYISVFEREGGSSRDLGRGGGGSGKY